MAPGRFEGRVVAIRGAVIELAFDDELPLTGDAAIALQPTTGLRRGDRARRACAPLAREAAS